MFGWWKKNEGFVWHEYVRTTVLVRRGKRREKIAEAKRAAVEGLADAGKRGAAASASGFEVAGKKLRDSLSAGGKAASVLARQAGVGAKRAGTFARRHAGQAGEGLMRGGRVLVKAGGEGLARGAKGLVRGGKDLARLSGVAGDRLGAVAGPLLRRDLALPFGVLAVAAITGSVSELLSSGFSAVFVIASLVAVGAGGFAIACLPTGTTWPPASRAWDALASGWPQSLRMERDTGLKMALGAGALAAMFGIGYWLSGPLVSGFSSLVPTGLVSAERIEGQARALSGDTLSIDGNVVRLAGIEAPEIRQRCKTRKGRRWRCGRGALSALRKITGRKTVTCNVDAAAADGVKVGTCRIGDMDLGAEMVTRGLVFARSGVFVRYGSQEAEARAAKIGMWRGTPQRPEVFRAQAWKVASAKAPNGCPVKGPILSSRGKVYLMPWWSKYDRTRVRKRRGGRWFCSEREAREAGWKPYQRS